MADPKYANLPGIALNEPDVFETTDLPEDDQAQFESEELNSVSVERIVVSPNAAFDEFKEKHVSSKDTDFSDRISKGRRTGYEAGDYEMLEDGSKAKETPQQWYQRLQHEIRELAEEVQSVQTLAQDTDKEDKLSPVVLSEQVSGLRQQLASLQLERSLGPHASLDLADPHGALAKRLLTQLDTLKSGRPDGAEPKGSGKAGGDGAIITYELLYRPEHDKFQHVAKAADMEKRLSELEAVVGKAPDKPNPIAVGLQSSTVMGALELMQLRLGVLDPANLDQIEARLQGVLGKLNEVTKQKDYAEEAETQSKIHDMDRTVQNLNLLNSCRIYVYCYRLIRVVSVLSFCDAAMQFGQLLSHLESTQHMISSSVQTNSSLLAQLNKTMKDNASSIEKNFKGLESRMRSLCE
uniref:Dynactin 2 (p50) n=1 Tax=Petromyzon marinus TaxID=7757 RepID=S4RRQ6_PETMA